MAALLGYLQYYLVAMFPKDGSVIGVLTVWSTVVTVG